MLLSALHQPIEPTRDTKPTWVERMLGVGLLPEGSGAPLVSTQPGDRIDSGDFVKRLSPETQRVLREFKPL